MIRYDLHSDNFFLGATHIDYYLAYVDSIHHTTEVTKIAAQDSIVTLEAITIEVNSKWRKLMNICWTKWNVTSC